MITILSQVQLQEVAHFVALFGAEASKQHKVVLKVKAAPAVAALV